MDVTADADVQRVLASVMERRGRLDLLVNNAAVDHTSPLEELSVPQFDEVLDTNLRAAFLTRQHVVPHFKRRGGGTIVNAVSTAALRVWPNASAYHASKWGLLAFTHALNRELREHGIRVTASHQRRHAHTLHHRALSECRPRHAAGSATRRRCLAFRRLPAGDHSRA